MCFVLIASRETKWEMLFEKSAKPVLPEGFGLGKRCNPMEIRQSTPRISPSFCQLDQATPHSCHCKYIDNYPHKITRLKSDCERNMVT